MFFGKVFCSINSNYVCVLLCPNIRQKNKTRSNVSRDPSRTLTCCLQRQCTDAVWLEYVALEVTHTLLGQQTVSYHISHFLNRHRGRRLFGRRFPCLPHGMITLHIIWLWRSANDTLHYRHRHYMRPAAGPAVRLCLYITFHNVITKWTFTGFAELWRGYILPKLWDPVIKDTPSWHRNMIIAATGLW